MEKRVHLTYLEILDHPDFVKHFNTKDHIFGSPWREELENNSDFRHEYETASFIFYALTSHKKIKHSDDEKVKQVNQLMARIKNDEKIYQKTKRINWGIFLKIAASLLIIISISLLFIFERININFAEQKQKTIELIVPSGEKSQLILSDGTKVWLNSESKLTFPVNLSGNERKVILEGEGYFDVSKIKNSHFVVYSQDIKVKVIGTKFNLKSYPRDRTIETTVVEGIVKVESEKGNMNFSPVLLRPKEKMVFQKRKFEENISVVSSNTIGKSADVPVQKEITITNVNTENVTCWKDQLLVFDNETLEEIAVKMSRWFKIDVAIDPLLKSQRYTGKFVYNESLEQVLEAINLTTPIKYNIDKNHVLIQLNRKH